MRCPACNHDNREGARFCDACGVQLARLCSDCGAELRAAARFCDSCGKPVALPTTSAPALQPEPRHSDPTSFANGRYRVSRLLGEGGKKRVYLAHDTRLDRDVAFALIKTEGLDEAGRARVTREAQAMGRLGGCPRIENLLRKR